MTNENKKILVNKNLDLIAPMVNDATFLVDDALINLYYQVASQAGESANTDHIKSLFDSVRERIRLIQIETACVVTNRVVLGEEL